jgi:hypothetical protein
MNVTSFQNIALIISLVGIVVVILWHVVEWIENFLELKNEHSRCLF